jgi:broad specificity phosphatase PhoE
MCVTPIDTKICHFPDNTLQKHWSHLPGNGEVTWEDAHLVDEGIEQARILGQTYASAFSEDQMPVPESIYTSPLTRCLETTKLVFEPGMKQQGAPFRPIVKELLRERLTDHTCDKRSSKSWITQHYPDYVLEPSFAEDDRLWTGGRWETNDEHVARKQRVLEDIFVSDKNSFVALTTHSYAISAILEVVGLKHFRVREGSSIALLIGAEVIST